MKTNSNDQDGYNPIKRFKLTEGQCETYFWLKKQDLNTDENTLCYWTKKYSMIRIKEVTEFAKSRACSQSIKNIGGWINNLLKSNLPVVNDRCINNKKYLEKFILKMNWKNVRVFEKYIKGENMEEDLPLTLESDVFERSLEAFYRKSQLYK